ncbi:MAG: relaxase/mobilization nuclease domain-containing protein [Colwellia sp.]|nr:relaxase/mobilization nuclease domain-containing protein [Colwellia sp.]
MIAEFLEKPANSNRNNAQFLLPYMCGATKDCKQTDPKHVHTGLKDKIHFIGCSKNMCIVDPLHKIENGKVVKLEGSEADLREIIKTFDDSESKNERTKFPLEHIVLSLPSDEQLTLVQWLEAVQIYIDEMGYDNCTWASTLHQDSDSEHCHIAVCNISNEPPHNSINPSNKFKLSAEARTKIEERFDLSHTLNPFEDKIQIKNPKLQKNQIKNYVRVSIDEVMQKNANITLPQFQLEMQIKDIGVFASLKSHETQIQGISFSYAGTKMKASHLGKGYKTKDLIEQGLNYDMHRDLHQVTELNEAEKDRCEMIKAIAGEAERFANNFIDQQEENANSCLTTLRSEDDHMTKALSNFSSEYYIVSLMSQDDIEATYQNQETHSYSMIGEALSNIEFEPISRMCCIAVDPKDIYGIKAQKAMANEKLRLIKAKNDKLTKKLIREWLKVLMMLLSSAKPSCYKKGHMLPRRGYDLGPLNYRFDKSPALILSKREMAEMLFNGNTLRVRSNVEYKTERFVTINKKNKIMFIDRTKNGTKFTSKENRLKYASELTF